MNELSISRISTYLQCRKRYYFRYVEGLKPLKDLEALEIGKDYHAALAGEEPTTLMGEVLKSVFEKYIKLDYEKQEVDFEYLISKNIVINGRVDGILKDGAIVEHKTASVVDSRYLFNLRLDLQIPMYMLAFGTNRCTYTIIQKPRLKQKANETEEEFKARLIKWYDDVEINYNKIFIHTELRNPQELKNFKQEIRYLALEMIRRKKFIRNPNACKIFQCPYAGVCLDYDPKYIPEGFVLSI